MTLRKSGHASLAGGPIMLRKGWPHDPAKLPQKWPHEAANRQLPPSGHASITGGGVWIRTDVFFSGIRRGRPVGESNPSHPIDSGAATPVASRANEQPG